MKNKLKILSVSICMLFCFNFFTTAWAANDDLKEKVFDSFKSLEISDKVANKLTKKVLSGEKLDSMKPEYDNIKPFYTLKKFNGEFESKYLYPDGSVKYISVTPNSSNGAKIIDGDYQRGTYWYSNTGAKVFCSWGVVTSSFYADFSGSKGSGEISKVYNYGIQVLGGTFSDASLAIERRRAEMNRPAVARLFFTGTAVNNFGQSTFYLRLYVPTGSYPYATFNIIN